MSDKLSERIQQFYEDLNTQDEAKRTAILEKIPELFTDDILFVSPVQTVAGVNVFKNFWLSAFKNFHHVSFTNFERIEKKDCFFLSYTWTFSVGLGSPIPNQTCTLFYVRDGKVSKQIDYWDTVSALSMVNPSLYAEYTKLIAKAFSLGAPYQTDPGLPPIKQPDGCYHPSTPEEISALVRQTKSEGGKIRVAGSGHSVWSAIAPKDLDLNPGSLPRLLVLDKMRAIQEPQSIDGSEDKLVEVEAGCYLGQSPQEPFAETIGEPPPPATFAPSVTTQGTWETSLLYFLEERGLALPDLGGITHQSVGGFLATGSAGGTCKYSLGEAIESFKVVDGEGKIHCVRADGDTKDAFAALGISMGLCGIIASVTFRCIPTYGIKGSETVGKAADHQCVDFYNLGTGKPTISQFLTDTDYTRMMWWPQYQFDRLVVWQAERVAPGLKPIPYAELGKLPILKQCGVSILFTILGNIDDPDQARIKLQTLQKSATFKDLKPHLGSSGLFKGILEASEGDDTGIVGELEKLKKFLPQELFAKKKEKPTEAAPWYIQLIIGLLDQVIGGELKHLEHLCKLFKPYVPYAIPYILGPFVTLNDEKHPPQQFQDTWWNGLPMDNGMDDILMPTWFTEIWIPYTKEGGEAEKVIDTLRTLFKADGTAPGCYKATGAFSVEIYATGGGTQFDLDVAYGAENVLRIDVFWFGRNVGDPLEFYGQFFEALKEFPFRLHWGKFLPREDQLSAETLTKRFPRYEAFKKARNKADPHELFLTEYWREHLRL